MNLLRCAALVAALFVLAAPLRADESFAKVLDEVNPKVVKLFGSGGIRGLPSYGTGIVVSSDGYILTVASVLLDTQDLRVHLADGRRFHAKVVATEPQLDVALVRVEKVEGLPYFDVAEAVKRPLAGVGTGVLAFSNQFQIATLIGLIGKELRNSLTETWINYAVPIQSTVEGKRGEETVKVSIGEFVENAMAGKYTRLLDKQKKDGPKGYHGLILVANVVDRTPPYVEEVVSGSPAAKAGFKPDDLIVYVEGEQVGSIKALREIFDNSPPGTEYRVEVRRGDKLMTLELTMADPVTKQVPPKK